MFDSILPLSITAAKHTKSSLFVEWIDPFNVTYGSYEVVLTVGNETRAWIENTPFLELDLEGRECQPFNISISVPGNCDPDTLTGSLLVGELQNSSKYIIAYIMTCDF